MMEGGREVEGWDGGGGGGGGMYLLQPSHP